MTTRLPLKSRRLSLAEGNGGGPVGACCRGLWRSGARPLCACLGARALQHGGLLVRARCWGQRPAGRGVEGRGALGARRGGRPGFKPRLASARGYMIVLEMPSMSVK